MLETMMKASTDSLDDEFSVGGKGLFLALDKE